MSKKAQTENISQILRGLKKLENAAWDNILLGQSVLRNVASERRRLLLKFPFSKEIRADMRINNPKNKPQ